MDGIIIDLTLPQFHKRFKKVAFDNGRWHRKFKIESKETISFSGIEEYLFTVIIEENYKNLISDYSEIMKQYKGLYL